ncbi:hypothetical protein CCACVL1_30820 [Corchorus capsularis]|uniref:G-patch domain-containing protein n=1 Tax=Corchorus capsularis TaxID=210143 RepID=A0A1R3FVG9_COCAP|nr:hypothetical protein CCACVL1_30820 [Corchorus capsularis]
MTQTSITPYVEVGERKYEYSPRTFEADHVKEPKGNTFEAAHIMKKYGWSEGQGLGKNAQGMKEILPSGV